MSLQAGSQDSEKTNSVVGTQGATSLVDPPSTNQAKSALVVPIIIVAQLPIASVVGAPEVRETPVVVASASSPSPSSGAGPNRFADE